MKSSEKSIDPLVEQGRAIARGMEEIRAQKKSDQASRAEKFKTDLRQAAEEHLFN